MYDAPAPGPDQTDGAAAPAEAAASAPTPAGAAPPPAPTPAGAAAAAPAPATASPTVPGPATAAPVVVPPQARPEQRTGLLPTAAPSGLVPVLLVCGVSGSGKSTIGALLAERLGWVYAEADAFHPPANVAKMAAGHPLDDADRVPWLAAIGAYIDETTRAARPAVVTCSALKRAYRDELRRGRPNEHVIFLEASYELIRDRLQARAGHFFPADLLASQFRDLEPPEPDEHILQIAVDDGAEQVVERLLQLGVGTGSAFGTGIAVGVGAGAGAQADTGVGADLSADSADPARHDG